MRIAASMSVIGAVVGEWIGSTRGIGALILQATYAFDTGLLYSAILMSTLLAGAFFVVIAYFEKITIIWPAEGSH
jgi:NitT/TauT family transport system permease protein